MKYSGVILSLLLVACDVDKDGDGLYAPADPNSIKAGEDCNDEDANVKSPTEEACDGIDNDCDGIIDNGVTTTFYLDRDGDGYGSAVEEAGDTEPAVVSMCSQPPGYALTADDCDDSRADVHPNAIEVCDTERVDEDCDGSVEDPDALGQTQFYTDEDADGFGDATATPVEQCYAPALHVTNNDDCDDANTLINPNAEELAGDTDNLDEDCDGAIYCFVDTDRDGFGSGDPILVPFGTVCMSRSDEGFDGSHTFSKVNTDCDDTEATAYPGAAYAEPGQFCMRDADGDGYGDSTLSSQDSDNNLLAGTDCDDSNGSISPVATEMPADGVDQNCDTRELCYVDSDGDRFGSMLPPITSMDIDCNDANEADNTIDCDDNNPYTYPGAAFMESDTECRKDVDGDGYGSAVTSSAVFAGGDCDDSRSSVNPAAIELCSTAYDDDCDGLVNDAGSVDASLWYVDADNDGFGSTEQTQMACVQPVGFVNDTTDCNDASASMFPGQVEVVADGIDQNCDGYEACYVDADGDGYGSSSVTYSYALTCSGTIEANNNLDCDDYSAQTYIGAAALDSATACMSDVDGDGYGDASPVMQGVAVGSDCNDGNATIHPNATEIPADGVDSNCNNIERCYLDADRDGFGNSQGTTVGSEDTDCDDDGESYNREDCNDLVASIYIDAPESCNNLDDDCDGLVDEGSGSLAPVNAPAWYVDADGDGFGGDSIYVLQCDQPQGYVASSNDCNDLTADISPGITDVCFDGIDNNCDGAIDASCSTTASGADAVVSGAMVGSRAGYDMAVGDIDGDGIVDMVLTAPAEDYGSVYVIYGPIGYDRDLSYQYDAVITGVASNDNGILGLGTSLGLVDLNGNGRKDIVVGAPGSNGQGVVYVIHSVDSDRWSGSDSITNMADATITGTQANVQLGCDIESAGDVNGDSYEDMLLGACRSTLTSPGYAVLAYGQVDNYSGAYSINNILVTDSTANTPISAGIFSGLNNGDAFGSIVGTAGDVNGDGLSDILFGAPLNFSTDDGSAYLLYGDETQFDGNFGISDLSAFTNGSTNMKHGGSVGAAGDVNGDGFGDFWVGAPASQTNRGYVQLFSGRSTQLSGELNEIATIYGQSDNDLFGKRILPVGDLNLDGYDDVIIAATGDSNIGTISIFYGPISGTIDLSANGNHSGMITGASMGVGLNSNFGMRMALADINANGVLDIVVAADRDDSTVGQDGGAVFVFSSLLH